MFGRDTATVDPGSSKFWKEEDILRMPSLSFSLEVTSPEIPSTTAVCSGFLHSYTGPVYRGVPFTLPNSPASGVPEVLQEEDPGCRGTQRPVFQTE